MESIHPEKFHVSQLIFGESQPRNWSTQVTKEGLSGYLFSNVVEKSICSAAGHTPARWSSKPAPGGHAGQTEDQHGTTLQDMDPWYIFRYIFRYIMDQHGLTWWTGSLSVFLKLLCQPSNIPQYTIIYWDGMGQKFSTNHPFQGYSNGLKRTKNDEAPVPWRPPKRRRQGSGSPGWRTPGESPLRTAASTTSYLRINRLKEQNQQ